MLYCMELFIWVGVLFFSFVLVSFFFFLVAVSVIFNP